MATQSIAGYNGRMYISTDGGSTFIEFGELKDVTLSVKTDMGDATSHASAGWKDKKPLNSEWSAKASGLKVTTDAGQAAIVSALTGKTRCKFRFDPDGTTVGLPRRNGDGYIADWQETQPNNDLEAVDITIDGAGALTFATQ
jgi:predicted secreted protein